MEIVINDGKEYAHLFISPDDPVRIELGCGVAVRTNIMPIKTDLDYETMKLLASMGYFDCEGGNFEMGEKTYSNKDFINIDSIYALRSRLAKMAQYKERENNA